MDKRSSSDIKTSNQKFFESPFLAWYKNPLTSHKQSGSWTSEKPACGNWDKYSGKEIVRRISLVGKTRSPVLPKFHWFLMVAMVINFLNVWTVYHRLATLLLLGNLRLLKPLYLYVLKHPILSYIYTHNYTLFKDKPTCARHSLGSAPGSSPPTVTLIVEDALQCFHVVPLPEKLNVSSKKSSSNASNVAFSYCISCLMFIMVYDCMLMWKAQI